MRWVGIDYGTKRIGLAISDPSGSIASPLTTVEIQASRSKRRSRSEAGPTGRSRSETAPTEWARSVLEAVAEFDDVGGFVVGLPLNMDGSEGPQARLTRAFGHALQTMTPARVEYWDERLSSAAADDLLSGSELTRAQRKVRHDRLAAQIILQSYLDAPS